MATDVLRSIENRQRRRAGRPGSPSLSGTWSFRTFEDVAGQLVQSDLAAAQEILDRAQISDEPTPLQTVEVGLLRAWLADLERHRAESREHLESALESAAPEHLVDPFLRAGTAVITLTQALPGPPTPFQREVVSRYQALRSPAETLADPLTPREIELLTYLPSRLSNAALAARCFVSVNTVKTHMAHIYRKLGASGRDSAIARAREMGLLNDEIASPL